MKTFKVFLLCCLAVALINGCSPDDTPPDPSKKEEQVNDNTDGTDTGDNDPEDSGNDGSDNDETDDTNDSTESNSIVENVVIIGATELSGTPPSPNEGISLDVSGAGTEAYPEIGFEIPFTSDGDVVGAYIQFRLQNGEVADSYFDVDLLDNAETPDDSGKSTKKLLSRAGKPSEDSFDVDFTSQMEVDEFCYIICVYDDAGNISAPQEVCVTVNEWGGNSDLIGTWNLLRNEELFDGQVETEEPGVEDCDDPIGNDTDTTCFLIEYWRLTFNADGTFQSELKDFERDTATEPTFEDSEEEILNGNWSYNPIDSSILFVTYRYEYRENGTTLEIEEDAITEGEVITAIRSVINDTELTLVFDEADQDDDGIIDESYIEYYEKEN